MTVASPLTIEEYYLHPTEPECEFIDGEAFKKALGTFNHAQLQFFVGYLLFRFQAAGLCTITTELYLRLNRTTLLIPDVCLAQPQIRDVTELTEPPLLCIEILSPSDRFPQTANKCQRYIDWGVPACWVFDPKKKCAWVLDSQGIREISKGGTLEAGPFSVPFNDVFPD